MCTHMIESSFRGRTGKSHWLALFWPKVWYSRFTNISKSIHWHLNFKRRIWSYSFSNEDRPLYIFTLLPFMPLRLCSYMSFEVGFCKAVDLFIEIAVSCYYVFGCEAAQLTRWPIIDEYKMFMENKLGSFVRPVKHNLQCNLWITLLSLLQWSFCSIFLIMLTCLSSVCSAVGDI